MRYLKAMSVAIGTVVNGKIVVEGLELAEGARVTILTHDNEAAVRLDPIEEAELLQALDEADREEGISAEDLFERLRRFGKRTPENPNPRFRSDDDRWR